MATKPKATVTKENIQIIKAADVSVPLTAQPRQPSEEVMKSWEKFLTNKPVSRFELQRMLVEAAEGGGNGNCNIC